MQAMDADKLRELWTLRLAGLAAADALIAASRRAADVDELLRRADRMFLRGVKRDAKTDEEERRVRGIWVEWRRRAAAAGAVPRHS
jgi:hypothetical protein